MCLAYVSLSAHCVSRPQEFIDRTWVGKEEAPAPWIHRHITARIGHVLLIPVRVIAGIADTILGVVSLPAILWKEYQCPCRHLNAFSLLLASPYDGLIHVLNPRAPLRGPRTDNPNEIDRGVKMLRPLPESVEGMIHKFAGEDKWSSQAFARISVIFLVLAYIIKKVVEVLISAVAVPLSLVFLGRIEGLNEVAYQSLQFPGIVSELLDCMYIFVHPSG